MEIWDDNDLRLAWELLAFYEYVKNIRKEPKDKIKVIPKIVELKTQIREYNRKPIRHTIKYDGCGGYIELVRFLPAGVYDREFAEEFFEKEYCIHPYPSAYDCTGQAFTNWYKVFMRGGWWYAYHSVGCDV